MNNQELNSRTTRSTTLHTLSRIWLALAAALLLIPSVVRAQYVFENEAFPGDTFTQLLSINDADVIAGYHGQMINQGFILNLNAPNSFTSENFPGSVQTQVTGINNSGNTSGFYIDSGAVNHGFLDTNGSFSTVDFPGTTFDQVLGLNNTGQAAGYFMNGGQQTAFIFNPSLPPTGQFTALNLPGSGQATDINDKGQVSGSFATAASDDGFLWSAAN